MDIVLGTAQFGINNYGISSQRSLDDSEVQTIFKCAEDNGIQFLDTSDLYGDSLNKIIQNNPNFSLILKLNIQSSDALIEKVNHFLVENKNVHYDSVLFHNHSQLIENPHLWNELYSRKKELGIKKVGVSLYNVSELKKLTNKNILPDIVEIPYNIVDIEFEPYFGQLQKVGIEIVVRSIFMQGLFFMDLTSIPEKLKDFRPIIGSINRLLTKHNQTPNKLMIDYIKQSQSINKLIIGVNSVQQLQKNIEAFNQPINKSLLYDFKKLDLKLKSELKKINNWKKL